MTSRGDGWWFTYLLVITYRLLESGEVDCKTALVGSWTNSRHGDVGDGRYDYENREIVDENRDEEVTQACNLLHSQFDRGVVV